MKIYSEIKLENFTAWSGAEVTKSTIIENNKSEDFEELIEELYPEVVNTKTIVVGRVICFHRSDVPRMD